MAKLSLWGFAVTGVIASVSSSAEKFCHAEDPTCRATPSVGSIMLQKGPGLRLQEKLSLPLRELSIEMHPEAKDHNLPLCHHSIVHEVCSLLNGERNGAATSITKKMIADYLYTNTSNSCFDHADNMQCAHLCTHVVTKLRELGTYVMPNASDLACYTAHNKTHCDVDVRPTTIAAKTNLYAPATDHGGHKHDLDNGMLLESLAYRSDMPPVRAPQVHPSQKAMSSRRESLIEGGDGGMHYDSNCGDVSVQIANLFRIYPALGVEIPLGGPEVEGTSLASAGTDMEVQIQQYHVIAQAWAATVLRELNDDNAAAFRSKWFGGTGDLSTAEVKARVVRTFNFIKRELQQGFHYVYPADNAANTACGGSTMAYVWGYTKPANVYHETSGPECESSNNGFSQQCGIDGNGKYYVYLCQHWAGFSQQEQIATIIHEAAHHSGPGDKSYNKADQKGFPQNTQLDNAANYQNFGRDVLENAWGCAQPDKVAISGYTCGQGEPLCPCQAFASLCDTNSEVSSQCKATCGLCQAGPTPPPTPSPPTAGPTPAPCVDTVGETSITSQGSSLSCSQLRTYCTGQSLSASIQEQCPRTCSLCDGQKACENTNNGAKDPYGDDCAGYEGSPGWCGKYDDDDFNSNQMCCVCGGGN